MAYQPLDLGTVANDGTGDTLRNGGDKVNDNFVELYTLLGDGSTLTTDDVVLLTATQTLTNKTITGTFTGDVTGNADTATALETARNIAGQSFDGTANITIASTDLSDTADIVLVDATQTLTSKTLTSPVLGGTTTTASGNIVLNPATQIVEVEGDGSSVVGQVQLNCHTNAHGQIIASQPHSEAATNTLTLPGGTTIGDDDATLVSDTGTQTLTNKTLTSPTITGTGTAVFTSVDGQLILSEESQTGDGSTTIVVDPTVGLELLTSSASGDAATLADGSTVGQTITVVLESDGGGDVTLTPDTFLNGTDITFADAGDAVTLVWTGTNGWAMIHNGFGSPVIA